MGALVRTWDDLPRRVDSGTTPWLVDAVAPGRAPGTWDRTGSRVPEGLVAAAVVHGVEGWVAWRAGECGVEVPGIGPHVHSALGRHQRALADLRVVDQVLGAAGVPYLVVKGPALVRRYADPSLRSYVDLDIVVPPDRVGESLEALEHAAFRLVDMNWPMLMAADVHELGLVTPSGGALDLHWSLGPTPRSLDYSPAVEELLDRSTSFMAGGVSVRGLDPLDELVHLAVHSAAAGGHRLIWLADLRAAATTQPVPGALQTRAREWGAGPAMGLMLRRLQDTLGVRLAERSGGSAVAPVWSMVDGFAATLSPPERTGTGASLSRAVARASRRSTRRSVQALAGKAVQHVQSRGAGPPDPRELADASDPRSARYPAGGDAGRRSFLRQVEARRPG
jgi:hypothetical protein